MSCIYIFTYKKLFGTFPRKAEICRTCRLGHFFIVWNCSFFMGIIFCSSVVLVWTFNTRSVYNFITKEANIPPNLIAFFNDVLFLFHRFLKSGVTNELKSPFLWKRKKVRVIYSKQGKILLLTKHKFGQHISGGTLQLQFFLQLKKSNIWAT